MKQFVGIEAGGSKFLCALANEEGEILKLTRFPTETPQITLSKIINYIKTHYQDKMAALGIACFGPLDLNANSSLYGSIGTTPKLAWRNVNIVRILKAEFDVPIGFNTDVNAAVMAEREWGAGQTSDHFIYVTVGTGIGAGAMVAGKLLQGILHPEMGHMFIHQDKTTDPFPGICPYHQHCLEGLASGPAIMQRWSVASALALPAHHEAWDVEAFYLATMCANYTFTLSPQKIILGGGVMQQKSLFPKIRQKFLQLINGYLQHPTHENVDDYIVPTELGENAGIIGAIALAKQCYLSI